MEDTEVYVMDKEDPARQSKRDIDAFDARMKCLKPSVASSVRQLLPQGLEAMATAVVCRKHLSAKPILRVRPLPKPVPHRPLSARALGKFPVSAEMTQKALQGDPPIVRRPKLTEALLKKPPFRFLHDVITEVIRQTGFGEGLFTPEELNSANVKDKEGKVRFLNKIINCVGIALSSHVPARPLKIVAGLEAENTNTFLQMLAMAASAKVSRSKEAVEQVLAGQGMTQSGQGKAKETQSQPQQAQSAGQATPSSQPSSRLTDSQQQQQQQPAASGSTGRSQKQRSSQQPSPAGSASPSFTSKGGTQPGVQSDGRRGPALSTGSSGPPSRKSLNSSAAAVQDIPAKAIEALMKQNVTSGRPSGATPPSEPQGERVPQKASQQLPGRAATGAAAATAGEFVPEQEKAVSLAAAQSSATKVPSRERVMERADAQQAPASIPNDPNSGLGRLMPGPDQSVVLSPALPSSPGEYEPAAPPPPPQGSASKSITTTRRPVRGASGAARGGERAAAPQSGQLQDQGQFASTSHSADSDGKLGVMKRATTDPQGLMDVVETGAAEMSEIMDGQRERERDRGISIPPVPAAADSERLIVMTEDRGTDDKNTEPMLDGVGVGLSSAAEERGRNPSDAVEDARPLGASDGGVQQAGRERGGPGGGSAKPGGVSGRVPRRMGDAATEAVAGHAVPISPTTKRVASFSRRGGGMAAENIVSQAQLGPIGEGGDHPVPAPPTPISSTARPMRWPSTRVPIERPQSARKAPPKLPNNVVSVERRLGGHAGTLDGKVPPPGVGPLLDRPGSRLAGAKDRWVNQTSTIMADGLPEEDEGDEPASGAGSLPVLLSSDGPVAAALGSAPPVSAENAGKLVRDILETKKDLQSAAISKDVLSEMSANDATVPSKEQGGIILGRGRRSSVSVKPDGPTQKEEIQKIQEAVQALCQATNPLRKCADYLQEDIENMNKEYLFWSNERATYTMKLEEETRLSEEMMQQSSMQAMELEEEIKQLQGRMNSVKAQVLRNDETIQQLLRLVVSGPGKLS
ncbi:hypothetical protein CBR_g32156 [Chara braunii]|uniref:TRAF3-interacting protein 1 n=1 Tax=Chara braunii TaxID=69332 RepID=A0A388JMU9_CHABU|nr:hypothetical protein CBR_g32156 [Chara braunii]|eukprot:GBG59139.1 hypothetical protein CBR_g32156 [Chara braunii]